MIEFADVVLDQHRQVVGLADRAGGLVCALQIAGIDRVDLFVAQRRRNLFGLADTDLA